MTGQGAGRAGLEIDTAKPHPARMYDYFLGGKNNFAVDRETAEKALQSWGTVRTAARENRAFLGRAVRFLVAEAGIRQFLDIGTGLPTANNVHEVAQAAGAVVPGGVCGQRPDRAGACAGVADQFPGGEDRLYSCGPAGAGEDPVRIR